MKRPTAEQMEAALEDYENCTDPIKVVAARHEIARDRLSRAARDAGIIRGRSPQVPAEVREAALEDYRNGMWITAVAKKHKVSRHNVRDWLMQEGVQDPLGLHDGRWVPNHRGIQVWEPAA